MAQIAETPQDERAKVESWRLHVLMEAGFSLQLAEKLAHSGMGRAFARLGGWRVVVLSGSPLWTREVRQKPAISHKLFNGPLEVRLLCYDVR